LIEAAIIDASVGVKWVVDETDTDLARSLSACRLQAPDLFPIECANILWKKVRLHELTRRNALDCLDLLRRGPIAIVPTRELLADALQLGMDLHHPVHDCIYLVLALREGVPLVTADQRLANAARGFRKTKDAVILLSEIPKRIPSG
jgi:predicted nucleic acid-binding protein